MGGRRGRPTNPEVTMNHRTAKRPRARLDRPAAPADRASLAAFLWRVRPLGRMGWAEEQAAAAAVAREGCPVSRQRLIGANLRLVAEVARAYSGRGTGMEELLRAGNIGLLRAVDDFEPEFGARFSTHAAWWIKQSIRAALAGPRRTGPDDALPTVHEVAMVAGMLDSQGARSRQPRGGRRVEDAGRCGEPEPAADPRGGRARRAEG